MMYNTIDSQGLLDGVINPLAVTELNQHRVVEAQLPDTELTGFQRWRWVDNAWVAVNDHRGHSWYNPQKTTETFLATEFDSVPPEGWVYWVPGENKTVLESELIEAKWDEIRKRRNHLLAQSDWTDTASAPARLGQAVYDAWQQYRQALRDITEQANPDEVVWPMVPEAT